MISMLRGELVILFLMLTAAPAVFAAESTPDSEPAGRANILLTKGIDVNGWQGVIYLNRKTRRGGRFSLEQRLKVLLYTPPGYMRQWKVDERLNAAIEQPIGNSTAIIAESGLERYFDQRSRRFGDSSAGGSNLLPLESRLVSGLASAAHSTENNIHSWYLGVGGTLKPADVWAVEGSAGPYFERRAGESLSGARWRIKLTASDNGRRFVVDGWLHDLPASDDWRWSAAMQGSSEFPKSGLNRFNISYHRYGRRDFSLADAPSGRRTDEEFRFTNLLKIDPTESWEFVWDSRLSRRKADHSGITKPYSDLEFIWENSLKQVWSAGDLAVEAAAGVDLQQQKYAGALSEGRRTRLGMRLTRSSVPLDSLGVEAAAIRYRYDTPSASDFNDRDELHYIAALFGSWAISEGFGLHARLESDLNHLVYIYKERSGENRWTRLLRLSVSLPWRRHPLHNIAYFSVAASYSDYDCSPAKENLSRIYRFFSVADTLSISLSRRTEIEFDFALLVDDHGRLNWNDWLQAVSENGFGYTFAALPQWQWKFFDAGMGWTWHRRETRNVNLQGESTPGESVRSDGPTARLSTTPARRFKLEFTGSLLTVRDRLRGTLRLPDVRCSLEWRI